MIEPELMTAEEAARIYLTSRADELHAQIATLRAYADQSRDNATSADAEADALRNELQGITAIKAAILQGDQT